MSQSWRELAADMQARREPEQIRARVRTALRGRVRLSSLPPEFFEALTRDMVAGKGQRLFEPLEAKNWLAGLVGRLTARPRQIREKHPLRDIITPCAAGRVATYYRRHTLKSEFALAVALAPIDAGKYGRNNFYEALAYTLNRGDPGKAKDAERLIQILADENPARFLQPELVDFMLGYSVQGIPDYIAITPGKRLSERAAGYINQFVGQAPCSILKPHHVAELKANARDPQCTRRYRNMVRKLDRVQKKQKLQEQQPNLFA